MAVFTVDDIRIGVNSVILSNGKISNGVVVVVGSIANKDLPNYAIVVKEIAKVTKYRVR